MFVGRDEPGEGCCIREVRGHHAMEWRESPVFGGLSGHGEGVLNALGKRTSVYLQILAHRTAREAFSAPSIRKPCQEGSRRSQATRSVHRRCE